MIINWDKQYKILYIGFSKKDHYGVDVTPRITKFYDIDTDKFVGIQIMF